MKKHFSMKMIRASRGGKFAERKFAKLIQHIFPITANFCRSRCAAKRWRKLENCNKSAFNFTLRSKSVKQSSQQNSGFTNISRHFRLSVLLEIEKVFRDFSSDWDFVQTHIFHAFPRCKEDKFCAFDAEKKSFRLEIESFTQILGVFR